jgi:hypothetical protein
VTDSAYSPRLRTAVLLCGTGTAGYYQAGVMRALAESGVKIDVVAGHGPGVANALYAAIDGDSRIWEDAGPWGATGLSGAYRWRAGLRVAALGLWLAVGLLVSPLLILIVAAALYGASALASLINLPNAPAWLIAQYQRLFELLFSPPIVPTIIPRAVVLALLMVVAVLVLAAARAFAREGSRRSVRGPFCWRLLGAP